MKVFTAKRIITITAVVTVLIMLATAYFSDYKNAKKYSKYATENTALFLAIAKAESNFNPSAISNKGAMGLCQIMPKTAEWCATQMGISYDENLLLTEDYNAKIANFYMDYLLEKFDKKSAICAYNAGEGNVEKWLNDDGIAKNGVLKNIPFQETKTYLKKVQAYEKKFKIYTILFDF